MPATEVVKRWRRRYGPLKRGGMPRVVRGRLPPEPTVNEVVNENQLGRAGEERSDGYEPMHADKRLHVIHNECLVAAHISSQSQVVHRHENAVDSDEAAPEVNLPQGFVHHPSPHLWEPEVSSGE